MKILFRLWLGCSLSLLLGQSTFASDLNDEFNQLLKSSLRSKGPVKIERVLRQDEVQELCSNPDQMISTDLATQVMKQQLETVELPEDGHFLGDWRRGEKIAQSGKGLRFNDEADTPNGGNCYACHQITADELSYGTIGPSLLGYGKMRGYSDEVLRYTWGKIYNPQGYGLCSNMPRYGHQGILTQEQIKDVMGLLLDPDSPVNQ
jgi:sulfur-oxidizing protein SoxX